MLTFVSRKRASTGLLFMAVLLVFGCRTGPKMAVSTVAPAQTLRISTPSTDQASIALGRVVVGVRQGTTIAHFPRKRISIGRRFCNYGHQQAETLEWGSDTREFGNWESEFGTIFLMF